MITAEFSLWADGTVHYKSAVTATDLPSILFITVYTVYYSRIEESMNERVVEEEGKNILGVAKQRRGKELFYLKAQVGIF